MTGYLVRKKTEPFKNGETLSAKPRDHLAIYAHMNLRAIVESPTELNLTKKDRLNKPELLFLEENLILKNKNYYVFQTKYSKSLDDILGIKDIKQIPPPLREEYIAEPYGKLKKIANDLKGNKENCIDILRSFHNFARNNVKEKITYGRSLKQILKDYNQKGFYYGNCKEISLLCSSLCDCVGIPSRMISGKFTADEGGHAWIEACVPNKDSYIWMPVDPGMDYFNEYSGDHIFHSYLPIMK